MLRRVVPRKDGRQDDIASSPYSSQRQKSFINLRFLRRICLLNSTCPNLHINAGLKNAITAYGATPALSACSSQRQESFNNLRFLRRICLLNSVCPNLHINARLKDAITAYGATPVSARCSSQRLTREIATSLRSHFLHKQQQ